MSTLNDRLAEYLRLRRQLGFELVAASHALESFVAFLERAGEQRITNELAVRWACQPIGASPRWHTMRLGMVRGFARYLATIDPETEIPPVDLLPSRARMITPYLYCEREIAELMAIAGALRPALRGASYRTVIGLVAVTGIRIGEALALARADVDLDDGILHLRITKRKKERDVPLHESTTDALREYARLRDQRVPKPHTPEFFLSAQGTPVTTWRFHKTFRKLIAQVEPQPGAARARRRPHDLRHSFAVRTLMRWHQDAVDVDRAMPVLSTYLGHVNPVSSYWYLHAAPELMQLVARRLEGTLGARS